MPELDVNQITADYFPRIHRAALMLTGNPWDADDLAQETFLVLTHDRRRFEGRSSLYTWLYGILLNLERRERRRTGMRSRKMHTLWDAAVQRPKSTPPAEAKVEVAEWKRSLWSHVSQLPRGQRDALVLRFSEQLSYDEIAEVLECPLGTVKSRIFHGLAALRDRLGDGDAEIRQPPKYPDEDISDVV